MKEMIIILAHSGLDRRITQEECEKALLEEPNREFRFVDLNICEAKLSELYDLPFEQLALEQQRRFKGEVEPLLKEYPEATIAYFGLAPIPLAIHLGYLCSNFSKFLFFQCHHKTKQWYLETAPPENYSFELAPLDLPDKPEKGKGEVFIRVGTSFRIEPQHTHEVLNNPTNEFDLVLTSPNFDGITSTKDMGAVVESFQNILNAYANYLPDRDKIHLFAASTTAVAFALGTRINPNVYPYVQTYQYSREESPKYREAILITKRSDDAVAYTEGDKKLAGEIRTNWHDQLKKGIHSFIVGSESTFENWFDHITQNDPDIKTLSQGHWAKLPQLNQTSLKNDVIDLESTTVNDGFDYDAVNLAWKIDDGMFVSLSNRLRKIEGTDLNQAGRLFLFHEGLHYCPAAHNLISEIANGIGQFPKVIEEADYQADVYAVLYEYKYSQVHDAAAVTANLKKFFLNTIDTATETMWSFVDNGKELDEIQIRSMNRFLNWYWQWVRIEQLDGTGNLEDIIRILFDKPVIEVAGSHPFILNQHRIAIKLTGSSTQRLEIALFINNKVFRSSPTGISSVVEGFRELNADKIKRGLKSLLVLVH